VAVGLTALWADGEKFELPAAPSPSETRASSSASSVTRLSGRRPASERLVVNLDSFVGEVHGYHK
jgi:hypothetical protein